MKGLWRCQGWYYALYCPWEISSKFRDSREANCDFWCKINWTKNDYYLADGGDGSGENMLGKILMETRIALSLENDSIK